jgi:hypothetical protein
METAESWKTVDAYSRYFISDLGRVMDSTNCKILKASLNSQGYLVVGLVNDEDDRKTVYVHHLVANAFLDEKDDLPLILDHINRDKRDNRAVNLRWVTSKQNAMNKSKADGCSSIYKGVALHKPSMKWQVHIKLGKKNIHIGLFDTEVEGAIAYNKMAKRHFKQFACLNNIDDSDSDNKDLIEIDDDEETPILVVDEEEINEFNWDLEKIDQDIDSDSDESGEEYESDSDDESDDESPKSSFLSRLNKQFIDV